MVYFHYFNIIEYLISYLPYIPVVNTFMSRDQSPFYSIRCHVSNGNSLYSNTDVPFPFLNLKVAIFLLK